MSPLIRHEALAELMAGDRPPVLVDVRFTLNGPPGRPEYEQGHLPNAQWVDLERELSAPPGVGGRHPLPDPAVFDAAMRRVGVDADRTVVAYDAGNALAASRLWWLLTDAGHPDVRVLDGGLAAWRAAGRPLEIGPGRPVSPGSFRGRPGLRARLDGAEIAARLEAGTSIELVDVRAPSAIPGSRSRSTRSPATSRVRSTSRRWPTWVPTVASCPPRRSRRAMAGSAHRCSTAGRASPPPTPCWPWSMRA